MTWLIFVGGVGLGFGVGAILALWVGQRVLGANFSVVGTVAERVARVVAFPGGGPETVNIPTVAEGLFQGPELEDELMPDWMEADLT